MARGPAILPIIRSIIIQQHKEGVPQAQIGRELKLNRQTINNVIRRADMAADNE